MHAGLAREVRLRIYERIRLIYNMPEPFTVSAESMRKRALDY